VTVELKEVDMHRWVRAMVLGSLVSASVSFATDARAQGLVTQGIGLSSCARLANDIKPEQGLNHLPNALMFYWVQGYLSAANIYLLNEYTSHIDLNEVDEAKILKLVASFCKANPDKKPISAIDKFIREADKIEVKESEVFDPWEH
jgi:hypothetical protein